LVLGSGCLKGNIATQVGRLYAPDDSRRDRAFLWYAFGINIGAFAGPLICGGLGEKVGWHWGFATAGIGMLIGIAIYSGGARHLPPDRLRGRAAERGAPLNAGERRRVLALFVAILLLLGYNIPFGQEYVIVPLWVQSHLDRHIFGFEIPVSWYVAADGFVSVAATPIVLALWRRQAERGREPSEIGKIAIGTAMMAAADLMLAVLSAVSPGPHAIFFAWGFAYFLLASSAYLFTMPILLALVSRSAPPALAATLMGIAYAGLFVANVTIGWMGRFYEPLGPVVFWLLQAGIAAVGVGAALLLRRPLTTILLREDQSPEVASA
jgi:POT family proton-dependent oligopeptide transporter